MATFELRDATAICLVKMYPRPYSQLSHLLMENEHFAVRLLLDWKTGNSSQLIVEDLARLADIKVRSNSLSFLYLFVILGNRLFQNIGSIEIESSHTNK